MGTCCEEKIICTVLNGFIYSSPAVEKPTLQGVVLRFGPTGVSPCQQVPSQASFASWWQISLKVCCLSSNLRLLICVTQLQYFLSLGVFLWIALPCIVEFLESIQGRNSTRISAFILANTAVPSSRRHPSLSEVFCPEIPMAKQTMQVNTAAVGSLC